MSSRKARILKEARALFWPWCAISSAGLLRFFPHPSGEIRLLWQISQLAFWVGVPLLATLSLGNELQYRTLPVLLSQPVDRREI